MTKETSSITSGRAELLPALKRELKKNGCLTREIMDTVAGRSGLPLNEIYGVATFYAYLPLAPLGQYVIKVCRCLPCDMKDAQAVIGGIKQELGIAPGETTADGKFSLELVNCIGACDQAPAMLINAKLYGNLTPQRIVEILKSY